MIIIQIENTWLQKKKIVQQIMEKLLVGVASEVERMLMDHKKMKGLDEINWEG
jgi:hypothetical protein